MWSGKSQNSVKQNNLEALVKQVKNSTKSKFSMAKIQPVTTEKLKLSSDLQVLSSFDCVKIIPAVLLEYMSKMFLNEYGRSHIDFHSKQKIDEALPLLKQLDINCGIDQNCSTLFQYDKQYGLHTSSDKTFQRKGLFYCCPSVHSLTNATISSVCKRAQTFAQKSTFRESKDPTFLERVIEVCHHIRTFLNPF